VRRRAKAAGITTEVCNHTFRGTGITAYLENGGTLEKARQMAVHPPPAPPSSTTGARTGSPSTRS
jgi:integrase/recombinase XerD